MTPKPDKSEPKMNTLQQKLNDSLNRYRDNPAIEYGNQVLTYGELDQQSNQIANWMIRRCIPRETFIGVLIKDRMKLISTMLGILKAGCVFVPLDTTYPPDRLSLMIRASNTRCVMADAFNFNRMVSINGGNNGNGTGKENQTREFILMDNLFSQENAARFSHQPEMRYFPEDKIYLYFTSGTTGKPKGFIGKNKSLLHFIQWEMDTLGTTNYRVSQLTTPGFDAFLRDVFVPLFSGGVICIPATTEVVLNPRELINWIDGSGINLIHCVPSILRSLSANTLNGNNFNKLKFILLSGEKIEPSDVSNWYTAVNKDIQLVNLWGTSETTLAKTFYFISPSDGHKERIPVGKPIRGARVVVLDENLKLCKDRTVGELYIRTPYRTLGYCNEPELTQERFIPNPFSNNPNDRLHRTGDLGRLLPDGNIEVLGRNDRQVKIRGIRIELEEIERVLTRYPGVKEAAVIKKTISTNNDLLCAFVTGNGNNQDHLDDPSFIAALTGYLQEKLPGYMVPAQMMKLEKMPRNSNGKVDYKKLAHTEIHEQATYVPPRNDMEQRLLSLWTEILGIEKEKISVSKGFFQIGGNSLNGVSLLTKIHKEFNIKLSLADIFTNPTIEQQAELIKQTMENKYTSLEIAEKKVYYPMSSAQKRVYVLSQEDSESKAYNSTHLALLEGEIEKQELERAMVDLLKRHESFRTSFTMVEEEFVQVIHDCDDVEFAIAYFHPRDLAGDRVLASKAADALPAEIKTIMQDFATPFDLSRASLLRMGLVEINRTNHLLVLDMHHIITDGLSLGLLIKDFLSLYAGEKLPPLSHQYKEYAQWQTGKRGQEIIKKQEVFWLKEFAGEIPVLNISQDANRPPLQSVDGSAHRFTIPEKELASLKALALEEDATLFVILLALYNVLLAKISRQEDIIVGTALGGRNHPDLEQVIGMFANTLPLRNYPLGELPFRDFLKNVKQRTLEAFNNPDYQFEELVAKLAARINPDRTRNPLFDVTILLQNMDVPELKIPGLKIMPYERKIKTSKFDLTLWGEEADEQLSCGFAYRTALFAKETIEKFSQYLKTIIAAILENPAIPLAEIEIISEEEKNEALSLFNEEL